MAETGESLADLDLDRMVDNFDAFDRETAQHVFEVTKHARSRCPVTHSAAHGGYWLVTSYAEVRQALSAWLPRTVSFMTVRDNDPTGGSKRRNSSTS